MAGYDEDVAKRQAAEKEKAVRRQTDVEMRSVEICVMGMKRKDRGRNAKKKLLDTIWLAASASAKAAAGEKEQ